MSILSIQPNHHYAVAYKAPFVGPTKVEVEAEYPIAVLIMDATNLVAWRAGQPANAIANFQGVKDIRQQLYLKPGLEWYLVLVNFGSVPTAVWYSVQS